MSTADTPTWSIGELARRAGLAPSAIRYYERIGLLPEPQRASGRRRYQPSVLDQLAMIDIAQRAGFTLAETRTLLSGLSQSEPHPDHWRELAEAKLAEVDALARRVSEMRRLLELGLPGAARAWPTRLPLSMPLREPRPPSARRCPSSGHGRHY